MRVHLFHSHTHICADIRFNAEDSLKLSAFERHGKELLISESNTTSGGNNLSASVGHVSER